MTSRESPVAESGLGSLLEPLGLERHVNYYTEGNKVSRGVQEFSPLQQLYPEPTGHSLKLLYGYEYPGPNTVNTWTMGKDALPLEKVSSRLEAQVQLGIN